MITKFYEQLWVVSTTDINTKQIWELFTGEPSEVLYSVRDGVMVSESPTELEQYYGTPNLVLYSFTLFLALALVSDWSVNGYAAVSFDQLC